MMLQGLSLLEADTSGMARHGDGGAVGRATAQDWADRLQKGVE